MFDFVSPDHRVVGHAKYFSLVGGVGLPATKFSIVAEHVWLLEKIGASTTFLVFGKQRGGAAAVARGLWCQASRSSF